MPLSQLEEETLKRLARDNAPLHVTNPQTAPLPAETEATHIGRLLRSWTRPLAVVAGLAPRPVNGVARAVTGEDAELLDRTKGMRLKIQDPIRGLGKRCLREETLLEFYARTGVSAHQCRTLSRRELERLIEVKAQAEAGDPWKPWRPTHSPIPDRLQATVGFGPEFDPGDVEVISPNAALVG